MFQPILAITHYHVVMHRFYVTSPLQVGISLHLAEEVSAHALRVLRLQRGDSLILFNGDGYDYAAVLTDTNKRNAQVQVLAQQMTHRESMLRITLLQAISSGERMNITLQKAVELGVLEIVPIASQRSVVKLSAERAQTRLQHWQNIIIAACAQCGRATIPRLYPPTDLADWCSNNAPDPQITRLFLNPNSELSLRQVISASPRQIVLLVGAEGGLNAQEQNLVIRQAFLSVRLGNRILRTETAALAALAALQTLWGDLG